MTIEKLSGHAVKIYLSLSDLSRYDLDFDTINDGSENTRRLLTVIIDNIRRDFGIDFSGEKVYIEVFSRQDGCLMFLSFSERETVRKKKTCCIVCQFNNFESMKRFCMGIHGSYGKSIKSGRLYYNSDGLRLVIKLSSEALVRIIGIVQEYGMVIGCTDIDIGATEEYYTRFRCRNIIERLAQSADK